MTGTRWKRIEAMGEWKCIRIETRHWQVFRFQVLVLIEPKGKDRTGVGSNNKKKMDGVPIEIRIAGHVPTVTGH